MDEKLEALCQQLNTFEFVQCGMHHERVQRVAGGEEPIRNPLQEDEYLRTKYCSSDTRRNRLGCAHTMARTNLKQIIDQLSGFLPDGQQLVQWKKTLDDLNFSIIQVDRQKSDAELAHAEQCEAFGQDGGGDTAIRQQIDSTTDHIQGLIETHSEYVMQLQALRDEVLQAVQSAMKA